MTVDRAELLARKITSITDAMKWIEELALLKMDFHFEDSPETIFSTITGQRLFTDAEVPLVSARLDEIYSVPGEWTEHGGCPIGYLLTVCEWRDEAAK